MRLSAMMLAWCCLMPFQRMAAQPRAPTDGGLTRSIGQPRPWKWSAGGGIGRSKGETEELLSAVEGRLGAYHDLMNPVVGVAGLNVEGYLGTRGTKIDGGLRAHVTSPALRLGVGVDYNAKTNRSRADISYYHPFRRGGLFHDGSTLRLDVMPGKRPYVMLGFDKPIARRVPTGKTRPYSDRSTLSVGRAVTAVAPPRDMSARVAPIVAAARAAAGNIRVLNVPFLDHPAANQRRDAVNALARIHALQRELAGETVDGATRYRMMHEEVLQFHDLSARAFSMALRDSPADDELPSAAGTAVALQARAVLLAEVLLPYNRMLGQIKEHDTTRELANRARGIFLRWLYVESSVPAARHDAVLWVFTALLDIVEENRAAIRQAWGDSRFVWLPLQYALTPDQHDTQRKLDAIIEQAVDHQFTDGNSVSYIISEQFQYELNQSIKRARQYHVLWVHDFRGFDTQGDPDQNSYSHVLRSYLETLTQRVREYDSTGTFPVYVILLDQFFYQENRSRLWMSLLEDPTRHRIHLPKSFRFKAAWEDSLRIAQDSLRSAIAHSKLLQSQRVQFSDAWLRDLVSVHVNITNVADQSFWSWTLVKGLATPDNMMRDHRKVAFYDITELDPNSGAAIYTGAGVGEHYSSTSWEDRALEVKGPAVLSLKTAAREALLQQGFRAADIPYPLQPLEKPVDYGARIRVRSPDGGQQFRALGLHNQTGFDAKDINVAKAVLYTLMPPGSVIKVPDSLWGSSFWGSALVGAALRGVRVLVIAPSYANMPANSFGGMVRSQELLWRMITVSNVLAPNIERAGGLLKVGVYSTDLQVNDIPGKVQAVRRTFIEQEWLRTLYGLPDSVWVKLGQLADNFPVSGRVTRDSSDFEADTNPKLHLKANYFASKEAWTVMARSDWMDYTAAFVRVRMTQSGNRQNAVVDFSKPPEHKFEPDETPLKAWRDGLSPTDRERSVFFTIMGSANQNARSMITDGEDAFIVSSWIPVLPYIDLISLVGQSRWLDKADDVYTLIPPSPTWKRWIAHWAKLAF